jgi:D-tyrosyl-tRNA(Tyr) deacylase
MRAVIQRVSNANVSVNNQIVGSINEGLLVFIGIEDTDDANDADWLCQKIVNMRIFNDDAGLMNKSVLDIDGEILAVSQFTLHAATKKGNRPSFIKAAKPEVAIPKYEKCIELLSSYLKKPIKQGIFGANMQVTLTNNGPVTIIIDSKNKY